MKCKNCGHEIVKRYSTSQGQSIVQWKHKSGGTYCAARWKGNKPLIGGCLCNNAEPKEEEE